MGTTLLHVERHKRRYHGSDDRYTPPWLLERVTALLGQNWFDPCPASHGKVPEVNGLAIPWQGKVYCNPPYSRMYPWVAKFVGDAFDEGLFLAPAYTDTKWFQPLFDLPILFTRGRIRFMDADGKEMGQPPFGSALVYRGTRPYKFADTFGDLGRITIAAPLGATWREHTRQMLEVSA